MPSDAAWADTIQKIHISDIPAQAASTLFIVCQRYHSEFRKLDNWVIHVMRTPNQTFYLSRYLCLQNFTHKLCAGIHGSHNHTGCSSDSGSARSIRRVCFPLWLLVCEFLKHQSRLPKEGEENVLVTSALPYCNNVPHLGQWSEFSYYIKHAHGTYRKYHWQFAQCRRL